MALHPLAGKPAPASILEDVPALLAAFHDQSDNLAPVSFGTSGHRGTSLAGSYNRPHIIAIAKAIAEYRADAGIAGPLFVGADTHALSEPSRELVIGVLTAAGATVVTDANAEYLATPVISHAILGYNSRSIGPQADGVIITPSHNPPADGGIKYNPPSGGPADTDVRIAPTS